MKLPAMKPPVMKRPPTWVIAWILGISVVLALILAFAFHLGLYALWNGLGLFAIGVFMAFRAFGRLGRP